MKKVLPGHTIVWLDVDSVLVNFYSYFHEYLLKNYEISIDANFIPNSWTYEGLLGERSFNEVFSKLPEDWTLWVKAYPTAAEFTHKLHELGCHIILITHVPESQKVHRMQSLIEQGIYFDEIYFPFGSPKSTVAKALAPRYQSKGGEEIHGVFVDDYMKNVVDMAQLPQIHKCFSLDYPFNRNLISADEQKCDKIDYSAKDPAELYEKVLGYIRFKKSI